MSEEKVDIPVRMDYFAVDSHAAKGLLEIEKYIHNSSLDKKLLHLIKYRASQINGCAYCLDMHSKDARQLGETEQRIYGVSAWRDAPYYTAKERAALEWTEAVTLISTHEIDDELYAHISKYFDEKELLALNMVIIGINAWNRLAIPFKSKAGDYQPGQH